ncbi:MAG: NUDIX hydrolase [Isosphaeraceae bacterium]|nr:NUDIX hydrolase [Isosphaeraceae bacterium]
MPPPYCYDYPRPAVTVDMVVFGLEGAKLCVLMIRRRREPFADHWALPGGFLDIDEPIQAAALRELREETGLDRVELVAPIGVFGEPGRDPRGRTISLVHGAVVRAPLPAVAGADDAAAAAWIGLDRIDRCAFDHEQILIAGLQWLAISVELGPVGLALLPEEFTDDDAERLLAALGGSPGEGIAWRKHLQKFGLVHRLPGRRARYRAARQPGGEDSPQS